MYEEPIDTTLQPFKEKRKYYQDDYFTGDMELEDDEDDE